MLSGMMKDLGSGLEKVCVSVCTRPCTCVYVQVRERETKRENEKERERGSRETEHKLRKHS